ncbi:lysylphosphatidylglycerol synthase domain-containing protein [Glycomyces sp. YM15]|uniref:lysylphosphatidylglycerol synthase domain-containing protein n=1 Tax=Glycomyces sp. YM15 TaxID=2800446 RepID=UPI0019664616|nr:lysylphosphatidylglycerol synthase domain-containing protein [Glycomyces sp. YM15]
MKRILWRLSGIVVMAAVVVAVAAAMRGQDWSAALAFASGEHMPQIALAALINLAGLVLGMLAWRAIVNGAGEPVPVRDAANIFFAGMLVKYLPGRLWTLLVNMRMGTEVGVGPARMAGVYVLNIGVMVTTGMLAGLLAAPAAFGPRGWWVLLAAVPGLVLFARPALVNRAAVLITKAVRRPAPPAYSGKSIRASLIYQTVSWLVTGHHLWVLALAAGADPWRSYLLCVGLFGLALVVGSLVVIVPDGLGIREGILVAALTLVLPLPMAGAVAVTSRAVATLGEVASAAVVYAWSARARLKRARAADQVPAAASSSTAA